MNIAYLCDRHACEICDNPDCNHTFEIEHAVNFKCFSPGNYIEEPKVNRLTINGYQHKAMRTAAEQLRALEYAGLGLAGEAGEVVDIGVVQGCGDLGEVHPALPDQALALL